MRYLAIDFGTKRLGLAVSDETGTLASPYATRDRVGVKKDVAEIVTTFRGVGAVGVVMGLPRTSDGDAVHHQELARKFAEALSEALRLANLPDQIVWWDERNSTRQALSEMRSAGISERQGRQTVDARAAAVILQGFLDREAEKRRANQPVEGTDQV